MFGVKATADITQLVAALKAGGLALFPTDTVWGIGVAAATASGPQAIFDAKRRSAEKPVAWLVGGIDALEVYGKAVPDYARNLAHAFWPGALTLVVRASEVVPPAYRACDGSVALRMPAHASLLEAIHSVGPVATSSANRSGLPAATSFDEVAQEILESVSCVFDDGSACSGQASTVVDCTKDALRVLRAGAIAW